MSDLVGNPNCWFSHVKALIAKFGKLLLEGSSMALKKFAISPCYKKCEGQVVE